MQLSALPRGGPATTYEYQAGEFKYTAVGAKGEICPTDETPGEVVVGLEAMQLSAWPQTGPPMTRPPPPPNPGSAAGRPYAQSPAAPLVAPLSANNLDHVVFEPTTHQGGRI